MSEHRISFHHSDGGLGQATPASGDQGQKSGRLWVRGHTAWEGPEGAFWGAGHVLCLALGRGCLCDNPSGCDFKASALHCTHLHPLHPLSRSSISFRSSSWPAGVPPQDPCTCWSLFLHIFLPLRPVFECHLLGEAFLDAPTCGSYSFSHYDITL